MHVKVFSSFKSVRIATEVIHLEMIDFKTAEDLRFGALLNLLQESAQGNRLAWRQDVNKAEEFQAHQ